MKASALVLSYAFFASSVLAAPRGRTTLADRVARRAAGLMGGPMRPANGVLVTSENITEVQYSDNWSGAVLTSPPSGQTFKSVTSSFVIPTPKTPSGSSSSGTYAASAWVGIDGDTCQSAILQTGLDFTIDDGEVSYDAWYEWYPDYAYDYSPGLSLSAGQTVTVTVTASSLTAGTASIENVSTGKTVSKSLTSSSSLCGENAEWIVEDFEEGSSLVSLANFGTVTFTGAVAKTASESIGPADAAILDIKQGSTVYTSVSVTSNSVTDKYV